MFDGMLRKQSGITLIETSITALVLTVGLLGAAAAQLKALQYADAAKMDTQASFIAYNMLDSIRANIEGTPHSAAQDILRRYALASLDQAPSHATADNARDQDLFDFNTHTRAFAGDDAQASIALSGASVSIALQWRDRRATAEDAAVRTFTLRSAVDE